MLRFALEPSPCQLKVGSLETRLNKEPTSSTAALPVRRVATSQTVPPIDPLLGEKQKLDAARQELASALERASQVPNSTSKHESGR